MNTEQILKQYNLDWNVVKKPLFYDGQVGNTFGVMNVEQKSTPYYALVREDTGEVFNSVSKAYEPTQNYTIINTLQEIAGQNDLVIVKAMAINGGRKIIVQMRKPEGHKISIGDEQTEQYVYAVNGHDGSSSLKFGFINKVISCQNQFAWLSGNSFSGYRHTKSIQDKVKDLPKIINFTDQEDKIIDLQYMSKTTASASLINDLVDYLAKTDKELPISSRKANIVRDLSACIYTETNRISNTLWGVLNGVILYTTHYKSTPNRDFGKEESIYTGSSSKMNNKAFDYLKSYVINN